MAPAISPPVNWPQAKIGEEAPASRELESRISATEPVKPKNESFRGESQPLSGKEIEFYQEPFTSAGERLQSKSEPEAGLSIPITQDEVLNTVTKVYISAYNPPGLSKISYPDRIRSIQ